jgi:CRP/FNR family transcriptional regulator, cyclic AMP receptor protein
MHKVLYILGQLSDEDIEWMINVGTPHRLPAGTVLIREGQPIEALYILLEGELSIAAEALKGQEFARMGVGELIGEISFVDSRPPSATVTAVKDATVLKLDRAQLHARLEQEAHFAARFYRAVAVFLAARLRHTVSRLGDNTAQGLGQEKETQNELDLGVPDNVHLAGARFERILKHFSGTV